MEKVFWILTGKCRKKQMNAAGQTGSPDPTGVSAADKTEQKRRSADYLANRLFVTEDQGGGTSVTITSGTRGGTGEGVRPDRGRWGYQRIELFDNAKALRVLCILIVPLIVKIFLNDFVDDLVDPVCEGILTLRDTDSCSLCFRINFEIQIRDDHKIAVRVGFQI